MAVAARALTLHIPPHTPCPHRGQRHCHTGSLPCDGVADDCVMACKSASFAAIVIVLW